MKTAAVSIAEYGMKHNLAAGLGLVLILTMLGGSVWSAESCQIAPISVYSPSSTDSQGQPTLEHLIDGRWQTVCVLADDTASGGRAEAPVTARFVLDLGQPTKVGGLRLAPGRSWANRMAANVSVLACDDPHGKVNVRALKENQTLPPANTFNAAFVTWEPVTTRYVSVVVNDSYNRRRTGAGWWSGARPLPGQSRLQCDEQRRCEFGWWWGPWQSVVGKLPQTVGGTLYDFAGSGDPLTVEIAEVSCFLGQPEDLTLPNPPYVACPESRLQRDWMYQDCGLENVSLVANTSHGDGADQLGPDISRCFLSTTDSAFEQAMVLRVLAELDQRGGNTDRLHQRLDSLSSAAGSDPRWRALYFDACRQRRQERLRALRRWASQFLYVKHYVFGGWTQIEPTDELTDEQFYERNPDFREGSQLCLATIHEDGTVTNEVLLEKPHGIIRDPNLSFDARTLVFSMRDNFERDDYHLYKMNLADRKVEQITFSPEADGKAVPCSDTEPCFASDDQLVFQSTRCGQMDVCWAHPASNLYACDTGGRYIRRLAFDQVRTLYPQILDDGRIIYTRWEYNDRNPFLQQSLFVMNADGTAQKAFYGNNSEYPSALIHARAVPGSSKVIAVVAGHHVLQKGKLAIIDRSKGSEGNCGIEYVAGASPDGKPGRRPSGVRAPYDRWPYDFFGQVGPQWQYPFALDEDHYLVSFNPEGYHFLKGPFSVPFGVYFMTAEGKRELLAFDWGNSCGQAIPVMPRRQPPLQPTQIDWTGNSGEFYIQDVYAGPGLKGVDRGTVKRLRVVALEYRAAEISENFNRGIAGDSNVKTPVSIGNGTWDAKHVLGEVDLEEDGSVYFEVPARTAVYFQLLDVKGRCVQTMRSWTMVQPGELVGCVGCHEHSGQTILAVGSAAAARPPQSLQPLAGRRHPLLAGLKNPRQLDNVDRFLGVNRPCSTDPQASVDGFSYLQLVQPIWDRHCITCHQGNVQDPDEKRRSALRLTGETVELPWARETAGLKAFTQSYLALTSRGQCTPLLNWIDAESMAAMLPPYTAGSARSRLMDYLEPSHYDVRLTDGEKRTVACWVDLAVPFCGSYAQANTWNEEQRRLYDHFQQKRVLFAREEIESIKAWLSR